MDFIQSLFHQPIHKIGFEDIKIALKNPAQYCILNTLAPSFQDCLIKNTISYLAEEKVVNELLYSYSSAPKKIIVYGLNSQDGSAEKKYKQLVSLGLEHVYLYSGGLFEWVLLLDIYGQEQFPTTGRISDILKYREPAVFT